MPNEAAKQANPCPLCGKARSDAFKPFCGRGCRDRDLLNWFGEGYRVPMAHAPDGGLDGKKWEDQEDFSQL
ncbi:MAG TPA: DNA gyrase inhibitor YacG [Sphingopyxis sp.]|nr:DNA gyrase inhibitor YacG [Sphingopyxis sp.]